MPGPEGAAETRSGGADTCEAPHLKGTSWGPPGSAAEHTPSAARAARRPAAPYLRSPRATGARDASSSQRLRLPLRLPPPLPPPSPSPPPPSPPPMEARTRRAQDSTAMSAAPRTAARWLERACREREREREGPAVQHADAGKRREDAGELRVACTVALLTSGSLAAGALPEAPGRERGQVA